LSAFGTASAAALTDDDTVYCVTPLYHASGLMMSIGGAVAGGSRLAMTASFEPETFWQEARRYGVTVASYTWTMLHELVNAPRQPGELHHGVRLFIGSGMPNGLWRRVQTRFAPARVLEFYAATEASAILVNVNGAKVGSMGRQLPGSGEVRLAAFDVVTQQCKLGPDGFARASGAGEVGMLLARTRPQKRHNSTVLRGVFKRGDTWVQTGDLFRRDADGDYWRIDALTDVVRTAGGPVFTGPIRDSLGTLPAVDLAVAYGLQSELSPQQVAVAAVTLAPGATLTPRELGAAFGWLPFHQRPLIVRVVDRIPVTTWYRPLTAPLRAQGLPVSSKSHPAWYLDLDRETYKPFTAAARKRLASAGT
jgi:putative long chain acyl-CoA synthase